LPTGFEGFGFMAYRQGKANPKKIVYPYHLLMAFGHAINVDMSQERIPIKVAFKGNLPMMSSKRSWPSLGIEIKAWANMKCELK
jgi:hypothetical protein